MKGTKYKFHITIRQGFIHIYDKLGPFAEATALAIVGTLFLIASISFGIGGLSDWAALAAAFVASAITVFFVRNAARKQEILVEVTMSYLIHGGKSFLDYLLGKLMGGRLHKEELKPGDALFDVLETICQGQDWEMKRRIVEALPALSEVNTKRTMKIAGILREDWEPTKWESDLRRRTVEALAIPVKKGRIPLIDRVKPEKIKSFLELREKDQVFTAMAIAEALHEWEDTQPEVTTKLQTDLVQLSKKMFTVDESQAIEELLNFLKALITVDILTASEKLKQMSKSTNILTRVAASRNVLKLSDRLPEKTLDLMFSFADHSEPKNVRRPLAKEHSVKFLIKMIANHALRPKAEKLLLALISDPDEIIRITTFDMVETLRDKDNELLLKICNYIIENETSQILRDRAQIVKT